MKLLKLHIESHFHLDNISFDFVYPSGHAKEGKPLEKICIIGQSATGKTSVLELIKNGVLKLDSLEVIENKHLVQRIQNDTEFNLNGFIEYTAHGEILRISNTEVVKGDTAFKYEIAGGILNKLIPYGVKLLYLSSDVISNEAINIFNENPSSLSNGENQKYNKNFHRAENYIYQIGQKIDERILYSLLADILDYRKKFTQMASELISKGTFGDPKKLTQEYDKWSRNNSNPLYKFAEYFNPILEKLNLEVDLVNTEFPIPIKSKSNEEIVPISNLSTGTKGLLLSMFPLFELDTSDAIILIDEPERSLFPDMQIDLIENYIKIAPDAQIIVATHSPFIAASFEPEERFILYYDENGKVAVRRGESPIGDDPNDILKNDFKVNYYNKFGIHAYKKYVALKTEMAKEEDPQKKKQILKEVTQLGDEYKF